MNELIYYPGFEIRDSKWLKFALLYIEKLRPIVPDSGVRHLSDWYWKLHEETDLLDFYQPRYNEGSFATIRALETVENILSKPKTYVSLFGTDAIDKLWKNKESHEYELFREKYSTDWIDFCLQEGIGHETDRGIKVPEQLAHLYMSILAHIIGDERDISPISDNKEIDKILMYLQKVNKKRQRQVFVAQNIVELKLPANLDDITLDEIIAFRNRAVFKERLKAFHDELEKYNKGIENGDSANEFVQSFKYILKDFTLEIAGLGISAIGFGLSIWLTLQDPNTNIWSFSKELAAIGGLTSAISIKQKWTSIESRRFCKKYMTDLSRVQTRNIYGRRVLM